MKPVEDRFEMALDVKDMQCTNYRLESCEECLIQCMSWALLSYAFLSLQFEILILVTRLGSLADV